MGVVFLEMAHSHIKGLQKGGKKEERGVCGNMAASRGIWRQVYTRDSDNIEAPGKENLRPFYLSSLDGDATRRTTVPT